jgi:predicted DNA-binding ribbon-helix-helix protein
VLVTLNNSLLGQAKHQLLDRLAALIRLTEMFKKFAQTSRVEFVEVVFANKPPGRSLASAIRVFAAAWYHPDPSQHLEMRCYARLVPGRGGQIYGLFGRVDTPAVHLCCLPFFRTDASLFDPRVPISCHQTSLRLEPEFWALITEIRKQLGLSLKRYRAARFSRAWLCW